MVYHPQYDFLWHSWLYQFPAYNPSMVSHPLDPECQGTLPRSRPGSSLQICFLPHPMHMVIHPSQTRFPPVPYSCKCCFPSPKLSVVSCIHREPYSMFMTRLRKPPEPLSAPTLCICASLQCWLHCDWTARASWISREAWATHLWGSWYIKYEEI